MGRDFFVTSKTRMTWQINAEDHQEAALKYARVTAIEPDEIVIVFPQNDHSNDGRFLIGMTGYSAKEVEI